MIRKRGEAGREQFSGDSLFSPLGLDEDIVEMTSLEHRITENQIRVLFEIRHHDRDLGVLENSQNSGRISFMVNLLIDQVIGIVLLEGFIPAPMYKIDILGRRRAKFVNLIRHWIPHSEHVSWR